MSKINVEIKNIQSLENKLKKISDFNLSQVQKKSARDMYVRSQTNRKDGTPVSNPQKYMNGKNDKNTKKYWRGSGELRGSASYNSDTFGYTKDYAPFVEYGHRQTPGRFVPAIGKKLKKKWVSGLYFLRNNVNTQRKQYYEDLKEALNKK